jgi:hypothetical protein
MLARRWGNILQIPVSSADVSEAAATVDGVRIDIYGQESYAHHPEYLLDPSMFIPQKTGIEILRRGKELAPAARKILEQLYIRGLQLMRELESRWRKRRT